MVSLCFLYFVAFHDLEVHTPFGFYLKLLLFLSIRSVNDRFIHFFLFYFCRCDLV